MHQPLFKSPVWMLLLLPLASLRPEPAAGSETPAPAPTLCEFLSDRPELIFSANQDWGELGWDVAAHAPGQPGAPLRIGPTSFAKGLGHHANGSLLVWLEGAYAAFDAQVGLQPCGGGGSVLFRVFVDGALRFESRRLQDSHPPQPLHVDLAGAQELRLEANDAGDGISCDMANWVDARLTRASAPTQSASAEERVDIAPFARVVTWDPNRPDGARAGRIEEFRTEDLFLETDLPIAAQGWRQVPLSTNQLACLGLQWLNRRALTELALTFDKTSQLPPPASVRVEAWFGESAWQGAWRPLNGEIQIQGDRLLFRLSPKAGLVQTQKTRWIFPAAAPPRVSRLSAFSRSRWHTVRLLVESEPPRSRARGPAALRIENGALLADPARPGSTSALAQWTRLDLAHPLHLAVRSSRPSAFKSDPTVLQFRLPTGAFGVAVDDVLSNACVYLPDHGLFITRDPPPVSRQDYSLATAGRKTILQQVRERPDQTLAQALAYTHHPAQREGPVMLSLACDNHKFILDRDGALHFQTASPPGSDWLASAAELRPRFSHLPAASSSRRLLGDWLPMPLLTATALGVDYHQCAYVAPCDAAGENPARLNRRSLCVVEFLLTNTLAQPAPAAVSLRFRPAPRQASPTRFTSHASGFLLQNSAGPCALVTQTSGSDLAPQLAPEELSFTGTLPPHGFTAFALLVPPPGAELPSPIDLPRWRADTAAYWNAVLAPAMQVETPEPLLNNALRSSQVRCLIAARNEADGARIAPWIAALSYGPLESEAHSVLRGMDLLGHRDFARRGLEYFIHRYNTNGFLTTGYTTFGTAWHLWTLGEHHALWQDTPWLQSVAPEIARADQWIVRQLAKTQPHRTAPGNPPPPPEAGLMPPGVLADWNAFAYHFALNAYYYAALRETGAALQALGKTAPHAPAPKNPFASRPQPNPDLDYARQGAAFLRQAESLRAHLLRAYRWTQAQSPALPLRNGTWIPHYPSQVHSPGKLADFFPGQDAGRSWCYDVELGAHQLVPTGIFQPQDPEVSRILDHMEDVQFLADGWFDYPAAQNQADWFNLGGFSKVQPYYTRNAEIYALRDDPKPFLRSYFNTLAAMLNPEVLTFWEHFHHSGAWDKTHETGYFLHQTRTLLLTERGGELWLAPFVPSQWLRPGSRLDVRQAPTRFGQVSYQLESHLDQGYVLARLTPPLRRLPDRLVLRLRHPDQQPISAVLLNGKRYPHFQHDTVWLRPNPSGASAELRILYGPPGKPRR